ncbi:MAG: site-specific integrase [Candidatus Eremiobacteraeota bacterium]|nr:site-specific integrase [Candidatus Eremiobacteraeota bacterium]
MPTGIVEHKTLMSLVTARVYSSSQFFYWYIRFLTEYETGLSNRGRPRSEGTKRRQYRRFADFVRYAVETGLDVKAVTAITPEDIKRFLSRWDHAPRMKKSQRADLSHCFNFLLTDETCPLPTNPIKKIPIPVYTVKKTRKVTDPNLFPKLIALIRHSPRKGMDTDQRRLRALDMAILTLALSTGMRRNALASIRLSRIDWNGGTVNYDDKGKFSITSPIRDCQRYLEEYRDLRNVFGKKDGESEASYLQRCSNYNRRWTDRIVDPSNPGGDDFFFRRQDGFPATEQFIAHIFQRWSSADWLGQPILAHMVRKYRGITAYAKTKDLEMVKNLMGHSTVKMTSEYLDVSVGQRMDFMHDTSPLGDLLAS